MSAPRRRLRRPAAPRAARRSARHRPWRNKRRSGPAAPYVLLAVLVSTAMLASTASARTHATLLSSASVTSNTVTSGTLVPPTGLTATSGGGAVALSWTPTTSTSATGYAVLRGTTTGGPYTQIATVSGAATTSYSDSTATGTVFYVLTSVRQNWTSVNSNQATATVSQVTTTLTNCTAQAFDTGGNGNGYEVTPINGCAKDAAIAQDLKSGSNRLVSCTNTGKDRHRFSTFSLPIPATVTSINGLEVEVDAAPTTATGTNLICVQLSGDAGVTWTAAKQTANMTSTTLAPFLLGSSADLWGASWTPSQLSNANFRIRLIDVNDTVNNGFALDYVGVRVTYTP